MQEGNSVTDSQMLFLAVQIETERSFIGRSATYKKQFEQKEA